MARKKKEDAVFVEITNHDIFQKLENVEKICLQTSGKVKLHSKWLWALSSVFGIAFMFIIETLFNIIG